MSIIYKGQNVGVTLGGSGGGGGNVPLLTRTQWDNLTIAQKQACGLVAVQYANSGFNRGNLYNGADYTVEMGYLPNSDPDNISCFARYENFDSSQLSWGEGTAPITFSAATSRYQSEDAVYFDSKTSSKKFSIAMPSTTCDFTLYCVAKGIAYASGDVFIMGSVYSWWYGGIIMLYHRSGTVWRTSVYDSDTDLIDTGGGYVAVALRSESMKASWFAYGGTARKGIGYNNHATEFTFGSWGTANYSTDLAVKFVGMSTVAESDTDIEANLDNLAAQYGLT